MKEIAERIKKIRLERGMTQKVLWNCSSRSNAMKESR